MRFELDKDEIDKIKLLVKREVAMALDAMNEHARNSYRDAETEELKK